MTLDPQRLLGRWRLARTIEDAYAGQRSTVTGLVELVAERPGEIHWEERGRWDRPGGVVEVRRGLRLRREAAGWWVLFEDGRPFHPWTPGAEVVHPCGADTYRGLVTGDPSRWSVRWDVTGPAKDYSMTSVLTPGLEEIR